LAALLFVAFLAVKLGPNHGPPVDISSGGSEGRRARGVLVSALSKLFSKGNGRWRVRSPAAGTNPGAHCVEGGTPFRSSTGHAATATYLFSGWLEVRLVSYVYANVATAQHAFAASDAPRTEICRAQVVVKELERRAYAVGKPNLVPVTTVHIGDSAKSSRIVIPARYKSWRYNWDIDITTALRGRFLLAVATVVAEPFEQANQALARELVTVL
jgi:hypothetical protein